MKDKIKRLEELKQTKCAKCAKSGDPNDMWCWNLPHCFCEVKSLREEIEGRCKNPISVEEHINTLLEK